MPFFNYLINSTQPIAEELPKIAFTERGPKCTQTQAETIFGLWTSYASQIGQEVPEEIKERMKGQVTECLADRFSQWLKENMRAISATNPTIPTGYAGIYCMIVQNQSNRTQE